MGKSKWARAHRQEHKNMGIRERVHRLQHLPMRIPKVANIALFSEKSCASMTSDMCSCTAYRGILDET